MFDIDELVESCQSARREDQPMAAVREVMERTVRDPSTAAALGAQRSRFTYVHQSDDLTVLVANLAPGLMTKPHEHRMWAVVGLCSGQEDNTFFRREQDGSLVESGGREVHAGEVVSLGSETVHAIRNPLLRYMSAIHVYGGDLAGVGRMEWDPAGRQAVAYDEATPFRVTDRCLAAEDQLGRGLTPEEAWAAALGQPLPAAGDRP